MEGGDNPRLNDFSAASTLTEVMNFSVVASLNHIADQPPSAESPVSNHQSIGSQGLLSCPTSVEGLGVLVYGDITCFEGFDSLCLRRTCFSFELRGLLGAWHRRKWQPNEHPSTKSVYLRCSGFSGLR